MCIRDRYGSNGKDNNGNINNPGTANEGSVSSVSYTHLRNRATNLPELFYMPDYDFLEWVSNGKLKDLSSYITEEELSELWPQAVDEYYYCLLYTSF